MGMAKSKITVQGTEIKLISENSEDYASLVFIVKVE
jgi:hypothetical protein